MSVPVELELSSEFDATATATVGFTADYDIGDAYVKVQRPSGSNPHDKSNR